MGFSSADGVTWTGIGAETMPMGATVYVGIAVTSRNPTTLTRATVTDVTTTYSSGENQPPAVSMTAPAAGAQFTAPATVTLDANASDPENRVSSVGFFVEGTRIATDTEAPYSATWSASTPGTYSLTAIAYDADGASAWSAPVTVTVSNPSSSAPATVMFTASSDHASNVTSYLLKVFTQGANPDTATPVATSDLGKPTPAANNDITVDRAAFFAGLPVGNYLATVTAIGPGGQTPSTSVSFVR